ncbi:hypothetical protein [Micromonospora purpureochromogenes]|uniref:hypothetical protein n=1 Tax=Micromonospora purpureochromogenes TaxID=47872 RepID=UPI0012FD8F58|nr:hypothetical protein [Micromonospora purpureochromogenes]
MTSVTVALAFVLAGLGVPSCPVGHDADHGPAGHHAPVGHVRVDPATPVAHPDPVATERAGSGTTVLVAAACADHRSAAGVGDGPDDQKHLVLSAAGVPPRAVPVVTGYRQPSQPLPPRGATGSRAPPARTA